MNQRLLHLLRPLTGSPYPPRKSYSFRADIGHFSILMAVSVTHAGLAVRDGKLQVVVIIEEERLRVRTLPFGSGKSR